MYLELIAVGTKMPPWVTQGFSEYSKRMPTECPLRLSEIPLAKRQKNVDLTRLIDKEGEKMLQSIPKGALVIALDSGGQQKSTAKLADDLGSWLQAGRDVAFLVGGPEGLAPACLQAAQQRWSLSQLTLPHPLVRIVVAEQLYRASSILKNHPYHR